MVGTVLVGFVVAAGRFAGAMNSCSKALPEGVSVALKVQYPTGRVVTEKMLQREDLAKFVKDHPNRCPGVAHADFYGDGDDAYAIVLVSAAQSHEQVQLVLARRQGGRWGLSTVESFVATSLPVVWSEPPGEYKSFYGDKTIVSQQPVFVLVRYDAAAIAYMWTGRSVEKVWLKD